ncbi:hypothetical protein J2I47_21810 [Fibrella sp. HMF5335]|uniref:Uncharacterized protein n=1 Tax=Fibrella rubiginis TaxID=2817060 RepID=A0A939GHD9_9BACT|nr:hypothetical protein [Fibrella rubiginis]MBO0939207.1 hypothetical protein [Fibrella rubiginis]
MVVNWKQCQTYEEARHFRNCIYLHEWGGKPFYWGKIHNIFFGGHMRTREGFRASGRYNAGYKHWIEGCLRHGASLYLGQITTDDVFTIDEVENHLIAAFPSEMNVKHIVGGREIVLVHVGDVPVCILEKMEEAR